MVVELDLLVFGGFGEVVELTGRGIGGGFETREAIGAPAEDQRGCV